MNYTIYIQAKDNFPITDWAVSAYLGFREKGGKVILFDEIEEVPATKFSIVVAYSDFVFKFFERLGIPFIPSLNIPSELESFTGRKIDRVSMGLFKHAIDR